ncbi:unnamed protein product [Meloidogyne enterolobii]|uniref:Uncharacterized protein n=1 Tax=Meloidogyne enterolobii TaxID=390850 RepID=A0ACB1B223_MELEN
MRGNIQKSNSTKETPKNSQKMSKFFFALVIVTIVFIHCCDAGKGKNKQKSKPQSTFSNPAAGL